MNNELKDALIQLENNVYKKLASKGGQIQPKDEIKEALVENFEKVKKAGAFPLELKVVGNMTLGTNLTGSPNSFYSNNVAMTPNQPVNVADLVSVMNINTGVFTYPRETGSEGSISIQGTENTDKSQIDYDLEMVNLNTQFLAGFVVVSKQMLNNLPYIEGFLPQALRRDYWKSENAAYFTELSTNLTAGTLTAGNHVSRLINEIATLMNLNYSPNFIVVNPSDYAQILLTSSTEGNYTLPGAVVQSPNGFLQLNGVNIVVATWMPVDKYIVADFSYFNKVITEGLSINFYTEDSDNVRKNNITCRVESQQGLAMTRTDCGIYSDFTQTV